MNVIRKFKKASIAYLARKADEQRIQIDSHFILIYSFTRITITYRMSNISSRMRYFKRYLKKEYSKHYITI